MPETAAWRVAPLAHLTWFQRLVERVLGGSYLWCPEVSPRLVFDRDIRRAGR